MKTFIPTALSISDTNLNYYDILMDTRYYFKVYEFTKILHTAPKLIIKTILTSSTSDTIKTHSDFYNGLNYKTFAIQRKY
jgi:hypothetical protein